MKFRMSDLWKNRTNYPANVPGESEEISATEHTSTPPDDGSAPKKFVPLITSSGTSYGSGMTIGTGPSMVGINPFVTGSGTIGPAPGVPGSVGVPYSPIGTAIPGGTHYGTNPIGQALGPWGGGMIGGAAPQPHHPSMLAMRVTTDADGDVSLERMADVERVRVIHTRKPDCYTVELFMSGDLCTEAPVPGDSLILGDGAPDKFIRFSAPLDRLESHEVYDTEENTVKLVGYYGDREVIGKDHPFFQVITKHLNLNAPGVPLTAGSKSAPVGYFVAAQMLQNNPTQRNTP